MGEHMPVSEAYQYGASYSPLVFPEAEWERDLALMREAGMNLIRAGDVHGSWDRIEPEKGRFEFEILERFYALAHRHGLHIILSTGASCPPLWLAGEHPDVRIVSSRGEAYPMAASYHWACIHHPGFLTESDRYLEALAAFAVEQPNHFGWQISNEIGFPFLPTRERDRLDLYCYCDHCKAEFRAWVREKYAALDVLNDAWMWSTTAFWYSAWEKVDPPEAQPSTWSGVTRWIDWRLFCQAAFARFARRQHDVIRQHDPDHPTSVNTFNFKGYDRFGVFTGLDQWQIAWQVDHIGYDLYPGSGNKLASRPEHSSMFLDHGRSVSRSAGTDFWLHEIESGPIGGWVLGPEYNTSPVDIWRNGFEALGHDVKLIIYMPWREWDYQPLHWGALVDLDGNPTPRLEAATGLGRFIRANDAFLRTAHAPLGEVALLESKPNAIFFNGIGQEEVLFAAQRGAYRAFWELDYQVDFATPAQVADGSIGAYWILALPLMGLMSLETAEGLRRFVEQGGLLVGFARCGSLSERGWYHRRLPIPGLGEIFGIESIEPDTLRESRIVFGGQDYGATLNRDLLALSEGTEVLATFGDGQPAVTLNHCGEGYGLYVATQADSGAVQQDGGLLKAVLAAVLPRLGIAPRLSISYEGRAAREIDPHLLEGEGGTTILVANYLTRDVTARLRLDTVGRMARRVEAGVLSKSPLEWSQDGERLEIRLTLTSEEVEAIDINWHDG